MLFLTFVVAPLFGAIALSFTDWNLLGSKRFIGLDNFTRLAEDGDLHKALGNTLIFTFWSIVLHVVVGLGMALAVNRQMWRVTRYFLRTAFFFPFLVSWAAVALIWQYALDPNFGIATFYGDKVGIPGLADGWLLNKTYALPALILVDLWHTIGFAFVVFLAGLQAIPGHLYEASEVDGAGPVRRFWHVTLPMLSPTIFFIVVISFIGAFQIFEPMYIMTRGGPDGATSSVVQYLYETGFRNYEVGYAASIGLLVFVAVLAATLVQFLLRRRWVFEG
ncbi:sugar ABC transporter permease [Conexibacter stalactiti]|uniref:Sugar ABC transporter permease n=1 Tax=Conexibacter stalactiti TaxID=1940611 RepID=A0ABU4HXD9_9ACTN|nr:sugar ABC transporter permease [Conexibacter stalactiti]MDW5597956.1 sugar ABC transporter permease [Conexibacter stalactiti]MEC5038598.1 sugar ABC transporter permease [Conexibacter stalactiti]